MKCKPCAKQFWASFERVHQHMALSGYIFLERLRVAGWQDENTSSLQTRYTLGEHQRLFLHSAGLSSCSALC